MTHDTPPPARDHTTPAMNPLTIQERIARACGYTNIGKRCITDAPLMGTSPSGIHGEIPDYLNDLNVMAAAEKVLLDGSDELFDKYLKELCRVVDFQGGYYMSASAAQRAEAFLRTLGLWQEAKP